MSTSPARRIPAELGLEGLEQAGDYVGPLSFHNADGELLPETRVFFLLPVHVGVDLFDYEASPASGLHSVCQPPHVFRECPDGSLEIRESIGALGRGLDPDAGYVWHGYLDEGNVWREC